MDPKQYHVLPCQVIRIGETELECQLDPHQKPFIATDGKKYREVNSLIEEFPELEKENNIDKLARLANFLFQGTTYHVIDNVETFKEAYLTRIEFEKNSLDYMPMRLIDHGVFDVNGMHPPKIEGTDLIFYAKDDHTGVPYRVTYPIGNPNTKAAYQLLPYKED